MKEKENIVMGYSAEELSAFAVLCDGSEGQADVAAIASAVSGLQSRKFFKTIGGVSATEQDDTMTVGGAGGIGVSANGKALTIDGSWHKSWILKLTSWQNQDVEEAIVASWMEALPAGSYVKDKYLSVEMADSSMSNRVNYWNAMLSLLTVSGTERVGWVAFDARHMCYVRAHRVMVEIGDVSDRNKVASIYIPHEDMFSLVYEKYATGVTDAVEKIDRFQGVGYDGYLSFALLYQEILALQVRVKALEDR